MVNTSLARENMLKSQILTGNILSQPLLDALGTVARESFVPDAFKGVAYVDEEIPLGNGRFLMEPLAFARLLEQAAITHSETVLVVGCATGYSAAVVARIAKQVVAIEQEDGLHAAAAAHLAGISNVTLYKAPLTEGEHTYAPYDVILIEGAVEYVPQALADQVKEGGRIVAFECAANAHIGVAGLGRLVEHRKLHNTLYRTVIGDASVPTLACFKKPAIFVF